jgi:hypothetical protein
MIKDLIVIIFLLKDQKIELFDRIFSNISYYKLHLNGNESQFLQLILPKLKIILIVISKLKFAFVPNIKFLDSAVHWLKL